MAAIPNLRAFAMSLCGNTTRADDLVQETLVRAWSKLASFEEGTNLKAWLFTILRKYIRHVKFGNRPFDLGYSYRLNELFEYRFFELYSLHLCE